MSQLEPIRVKLTGFPAEKREASLSIFAQPYDLEATGFYFTTLEEYDAKCAENFNSWGGLVEEYMIDICDGPVLACELANVIKLNQGNLQAFFYALDWCDDDLVKACIMYDNNITNADFKDYDPSDAEGLYLYEDMSWRDVAEEFVDGGCLGDVPDHLSQYIDYDAVARDLSYNGMFEASVGNRDFIVDGSGV